MGGGTYLILLIEKRILGVRKGVFVVLHPGFHTVAGDPSEPMFLCWKCWLLDIPLSILARPTFSLLLEIIAGDAS